MSSTATQNWSDEPGLGRWWICTCLSAAGLLMLWAGLIQQTERVNSTIEQAFGLKPVQAETPGPGIVAEVVEPSVLEEVAELVEPPVVEPVEPPVAEEVVEPVEPPVVEEVVEPVEPPVVEEVAELVEPPVVEEVAELVEPPVVEEVAEPVEPPVAEEVIEPVEPPVAEEVAVLVEPPVSTASSDEQAIVESVTETGSLLASLRATALGNMNIRSRQLRFVTGSIRLTSNSEALLQQVFEDLFLYAESDIVINVASLDSVNGIPNDVLARERATLLKTFLVERGLQGQRLIVSVLPTSVLSDETQYISIEAKP